MQIIAKKNTIFRHEVMSLCCHEVMSESDSDAKDKETGEADGTKRRERRI